MNWAKENKFEAGLLLLVIVALIGTYLVSGSKTEQYQESKDAFDASANQLKRLESRKPYPNKEKLDARRKEVVEYRGKVEGLQKALLTYRPAEFKRIKPGEFTTNMNEAVTGLRALYESSRIETPEKWQLGFEAYAASPPKDEATAFLGFQLEGMKWVYEELAKAKPSALLNVYRAPLPVEQGKPMLAKGSAQPYYGLPVELTFRCREACLRQFLSTLASSKKQFVVVRSVRIQNTKPDKAPRTGDVEFDEAPVGLPGGDDDPFSGFPDFTIEDDGTAEEDVDPADPDAGEPEPDAEKEEASGERVLGQVLGGEELNVFLQLELVLYRDDVKLPAAK